MSIRMPSPWKHPDTGSYYLRERVPSDILKKARGKYASLEINGMVRRVVVGEQVKVSLFTHDPKEAKERYRKVSAQLQKIWEAERSGPIRLSFKQSLALAGTVHRGLLDAFDNDPGPPERWQSIREMNEAALAGQLIPLRIGDPGKFKAQDLERLLGRAVDEILNKHNLNVDDRSRARLLKHVAEAVSRVADVNEQKALGDYSLDDSSIKYPQLRPATDSAKATHRTTISGLFELWKTEQQQAGGSASTVRRWQSVVRGLIDYLGHDAAAEVTLGDAVRWKDHLIGTGTTSTNTFKKSNRAAMSTIYGVGIARGLLQENPFQKLQVRKQRIIKNREKSFTHEEAKAILAAATQIYETHPRANELTKDARRWLPWLCAYTGARINELAQLRKRDVFERNGLHCIEITPESGSVKNGQYRIVPLHPHLIEQGFLEFAESKPEGPLFYDQQNGYAIPSEQAARAVREWVRKDVGVDDPQINPNHAWRHTFKAKAYAAGIPPIYADKICGHRSRNEGEKYGTISPEALFREIMKISRFT